MTTASALVAYATRYGSRLAGLFLRCERSGFRCPLLTLLVLSAFQSLLLTIFSGFAYDVQRQIDSHQAHSR